MHNQVIADIEIDGDKIGHYSTVIIRQQFNAHHEFAIRMKYDVLESAGSFSMAKAQKKIGKTVIIKLLQANNLEAAYEFHGIICEIAMEQSDNFTSDFVLKGYSPTILLETGAHLASFYKKGLQQIVKQITESISGSGFGVKISPQYKTPITYICQYRESGFHFMNRLSSEYSEWCYYDGQQLFFGRPSSSPNIAITYGEDMHTMQLKLRILPLSFTSYAYASKSDSLFTYNAPKNVDGLDEYASNALKESNKIFSQSVQSPVRQRVESSSDLQDFAKK
ncbi:MAG TPA: contractile injection system protein, VgrG/Pvc8 family, partial [Panacibacter sp.]|nr:contractile injection system protein, VgrG/Pvc8 family [Panacibacter sp.]